MVIALPLGLVGQGGPRKRLAPPRTPLLREPLLQQPHEVCARDGRRRLRRLAVVAGGRRLVDRGLEGANRGVAGVWG